MGCVIMKKIVIISKWSMGTTPAQLGYEGKINPFKKSSSTLLIDKLNEEFEKEGLDFEVVRDNDTNVEILVNKNTDLILISPYVKAAVLPTLTEDEKKKCYFLTENEFIELEVDNIVNVAKNL